MEHTEDFQKLSEAGPEGEVAYQKRVYTKDHFPGTPGSPGCAE